MDVSFWIVTKVDNKEVTYYNRYTMSFEDSICKDSLFDSPAAGKETINYLTGCRRYCDLSLNRYSLEIFIA